MLLRQRGNDLVNTPDGIPGRKQPPLLGGMDGGRGRVVLWCVKIEKIPARHPGTEDVREAVGTGETLRSCLCVDLVGSL